MAAPCRGTAAIPSVTTPDAASTHARLRHLRHLAESRRRLHARCRRTAVHVDVRSHGNDHVEHDREGLEGGLLLCLLTRLTPAFPTLYLHPVGPYLSPGSLSSSIPSTPSCFRSNSSSVCLFYVLHSHSLA